MTPVMPRSHLMELQAHPPLQLEMFLQLHPALLCLHLHTVLQSLLNRLISNFLLYLKKNLQQAATAPPPQAVESEISTNTDTTIDADLNDEPTEITQPAHDANNTAQNDHQIIEVVPAVQKATSVTTTEVGP